MFFWRYRRVRSDMIVLQENSSIVKLIVDACVIPYECVSVCSMPFTVIRNVLTIVSLFDKLICCFFVPFEADIYPGITRTRAFCEFCTTPPVRGTSVGYVRHSYSYAPELSICFILSVGYTEHHTWDIYPGYYPTKNFCSICRALPLVPGTSGSFVRRCHKDPGYGHGMIIPARNFWNFCTSAPQYPEVLEVL